MSRRGTRRKRGSPTADAVTPDPKPPEVVGGSGGPSALAVPQEPLPPSNLPSGTNNQLEAMALRRQWIPEKYFQAIRDRQIKIAIDPTAEPRDATRAFNALRAAERDQWERENKEVLASGGTVNVNQQTLVVEYRELPPRGEEPEPIQDGDEIAYEVPG